MLDIEKLFHHGSTEDTEVFAIIFRRANYVGKGKHRFEF